MVLAFDEDMIPTFKDGFLNDVAIELGLRWNRLESIMYRSHALREVDDVGERMNLWTESIYVYRSDMVVRDDHRVLVCLKDRKSALQIRVTATNAKGLIECFIDTCSIISADSDPTPKLKKIWQSLDPELENIERVKPVA